MTAIHTFTASQFSQRMAIASTSSERNSGLPSASGISRLIRRELRRRGLMTRRELRRAIEPYVLSAGFAVDALTGIREVADRMVELDELADLRVDHQRGYLALPSVWIELSDDQAVVLGVTECELDYFPETNSEQILRHFRPSDTTRIVLAEHGVLQSTFARWIGIPSWKTMCEDGEQVDSIGDFLAYHLDQLEKHGVAFSLQGSRVLAVTTNPGRYFGSPLSLSGSRWASPETLPDGVYVGAQPDDRAPNLWRPLLITLSEGKGRSMPLNFRNDHERTRELRDWLLIALSASRNQRERVLVDVESATLTSTFPAPAQLKRCLNLVSDSSNSWTFSVRDPTFISTLLEEYFPAIDFKHK